MESLKNVSLKKYNSLGVEALADQLVFIKSEEDLFEIREYLSSDHIFILGEGTNTLFSTDYKGSILKVEILGINYEDVNENEILAIVGAGENWHNFVMNSIKKGFQGLENLSLIPGSVGAAPIQNIGAYGVEVSDYIKFIEGYSLKERKILQFQKEDCRFKYRSSLFKEELRDKFIITKVGFSLNKEWGELETSYKSLSSYLAQNGISDPTPMQLSEAVIDIRSSKLPDPAKIGNAGSFFKNPVVSLAKFEELKKRFPGIPGHETEESQVKLYAGWLIEKIGWKGKNLGNAGVHKDQALVLINRGEAKGIEIYELSKKLITDVQNMFGVDLEEEVRIL